ncbi:hypothetical protein [Pseudomonas fluorescens]|uniref:hypothetical protein n=1 Tax=Pseudomonas fluorescens TaxID=294 RepID=UPI0012400E60|nr:hypothetical protein [Pseudomonas fluorescens]
MPERSVPLDERWIFTGGALFFEPGSSHINNENPDMHISLGQRRPRNVVTTALDTIYGLPVWITIPNLGHSITDKATHINLLFIDR